MSNNKERFWEKLEKEKDKKENAEKMLIEFKEDVKNNLPLLVNNVIDIFDRLCKEPLQKKVNTVNTRLILASDKKEIVEIPVKTIKIKFGKWFLQLLLNENLGFMGATAKIDVISNIDRRFKHYILYQNGIYISITNKRVFWWDNEHRKNDFTEDKAIEILEDIFINDL
ncbi:hypothetical protein KAU45_03130 [bacterium]|nr:hypothetical protein [bacterium]